MLSADVGEPVLHLRCQSTSQNTRGARKSQWQNSLCESLAYRLPAHGVPPCGVCTTSSEFCVIELSRFCNMLHVVFNGMHRTGLRGL